MIGGNYPDSHYPNGNTNSDGHSYGGNDRSPGDTGMLSGSGETAGQIHDTPSTHDLIGT